ncbi:MAG: amino acid adenylation domain-containing protein [Halioglobus sp.]|nr:amino acid adenylation domain-containing protein [Halioglobus sp.]
MTSQVLTLLRTLDERQVNLSLKGEGLDITAPQGAIDSALLRELKAHKADIVMLLKKREEERARRASIVAVDSAQPQPLSFAQQRLWFLSQLGQSLDGAAADSAYHLSWLVHVEGRLDHNLVATALDRLVQRHPALRTVFRDIDGEGRQLVLETLKIALQPLADDGSLLHQDDLLRLARERAGTAFDLTHGPLMRVHCAQCAGSKDSYLLITLHHLIADGWSFPVLLKDFATFYAEPDKALAALPVDYAAYANWQRADLADHRDDLQAFWQAELSGVGYLQLPTDYARSRSSFRPAGRVSLQLSPLSLAALERMAREEKSTLYTVVATALAILVQRYTGEKDFCLLSPSANRDHQDVREVVGFFVNTIALRMQPGPDVTVKSLIESVRNSLTRAQSHQRLPYDEVVALVDPSRQNPAGLSSLMLAMDQQGDASNLLNMTGLTFEPIANVGAKFEMMVSLNKVGDCLEGFIEYDSTLFHLSTIERFARNFTTLLEVLPEVLLCPISDIDLLSQTERNLQLHDWQSAPLGRDTAEHPLRMLQERCNTQADLEAVSWYTEDGRQSMCFAELCQQSVAIANGLARHGAQPGDFVAVSMSRGGKLIAALLGVMRARCAYVPLDPEHIATRNRFILEDSGAKLCLVDFSAREILEAGNDSNVSVPAVTFLDYDDLSPCADDIDFQERAMRFDDIAYVIYTSGSTGSPKGVKVTHRQLEYLYASTAQSFDFVPGQRWSFYHSFAFDFSVWEIWCALLNGSTVCVPSASVSRDPEAFLRWLQEEKISLLSQTPEAFYSLISVKQFHALELTHLQWIVFGGEALNGKKLLPWWEQQTNRQATLVNMYGITETTVHSSIYRLDAGDVRTLEERPVRVAIGHGIPGTVLLLLDEQGRLLPQGAIGEIHVVGPGVSAGYHDKDSLTTERFTTLEALLQSSDLGTLLDGREDLMPETRVYRSGDLARFNAAGLLEYIGRRDFQVKIRGFRIELAEVEAALSICTIVSDARVLALPDHAGSLRLVVYWVPAEGDMKCAPAGEQQAYLREHLRALLPTYMLPSLFVPLPRLPLTVNGKLDRKALPEPAPVAQSGVVDRVAPATEIESGLVEIWQDLLGVSDLSVTADLFSEGAHSLMFMRALAASRDRFICEISIDALFRCATISEQAECIARCQSSSDPNSFEPLPRLDSRVAHPMSQAQERLWVLDRLLGYSDFYHINQVFRIRGQFDARALEQSFRLMLERHHGLRTAFGEEGGVAIQQVVPVDEWSLQHAENDAYDDAILRTWMSAPFDLSRPPLLRALLLELAPDDRRLAVTVHHIVADGWSVALFMREVMAVYGHLIAGGQGCPLPPLEHQYVDFASWHRHRLSGELRRSREAYWCAQLRGVIDLALPTDYPRPPVYSYRGDRVDFQLDGDCLIDVDSFARAQGASRYMVLLAAFSALLRRYSGQDDIVVGTPVAGRLHPDTENMIGLFVNTLAMRVRPDFNSGFAQLVAQARETSLAGYANEDFPFEQLIDLLGVQRDPSRTPLFQAMLVLQNTPAAGVALSDLDVSLESSPLPGVKCDLSLCLSETVGADGVPRLSGYLEYNSDLFAKPTIERWAASLRQLLEQGMARPKTRLADLLWLTPTERSDLSEWGQLECAFSDAPALSFDQLFSSHASQYPDAVALSGPSCLEDHNGSTLTYGELVDRVDALAVQLRIELDLRAGMLVGVALPRCIERVVACMALWRLGAGYVPLDPEYPADRIADMVLQSGLLCVVTDHVSVDAVKDAVAAIPRIADRFGESVPGPPRLMQIKGLLTNTPRPRGIKTPLDFSPEGLAYVIFTSGSTGRPKGVQVPHRCVGHFLQAMVPITGIKREDRLLAVTSLSFDISVLELFLPLSRGAELVVASDEDVRDGHRLATLMTRHEISMVQATPATWKLLQLADWRPVRATVALCGGEAMPTDLARALTATPGVRLINMYGPTETTVWSATFDVSADLDATDTVPIGYPVANTRFLVVDEWLQPVPVGAPGRLLIAGSGVTDGYIGCEALSRERFFALPAGAGAGFALVPEELWYDTGDRVAWNATGSLRFLGREDDQVKLRGFRVELGDIEGALRMIVGVQDAAVAVHEGERLVAFLVLNDGNTVPQLLSPERFLPPLRDRLPSYMVPQQFFELPALPLTPNGKVNRRGLPSLDALVSEDVGVQPRTATERGVQEIWQPLLSVGTLSVTADLFAMGAHSLMFMRAVASMRQRWSASLAIDALFKKVSVAEQAAYIEEYISGDETAAMTPLPRLPAAMPQTLSWAQERLWVLHQLLGFSHFYHITHVSKLSGKLDAAALQRAFSALLERHDVLRTAFIELEGEPRQCVQSVGDWSMQSANAVDLTDLALQNWFKQPFDLSSPPLLRALLITEAEGCYRLAVVVHHIVADGWSVGLFVQQLIEAYQFEISGGDARGLPAPAHQYADFAVWQRDFFSGDRLDRQLHYWRQQLSDIPVLSLPTDLPRPQLYSYAGDSVALNIDADTLSALKSLARDAGASLYMALLGVFSAFLARCSGQDDIAIGSPVAGRVHPDTHNMIGLFVNTLVMRLRPDFNQDFSALLEQSRAVSLAAYANEDLPFERLVEVLDIARDTSRTPVVQAMLILQNLPAVSLADTDLSLQMEGSPLTGAKCDLTLCLWEKEVGGKAELAGHFEYNTDLFHRDTVECWVQTFERLLRACIAQPLARLNSIDCLLPDEWRQLKIFGGFHEPAASFEKFDKKFARCVESHPDIPALSGYSCIKKEPRDAWSYEELDRLVGRVAAGLSQRLDSGDLVGVALPRCVERVVVCLALWRLGSGYVPLDPDYPAERLADMLAQSDLSLLVVESETAAALDVALERLPDLISRDGESSQNLPKKVWIDGLLEDCSPGVESFLCEYDAPAYVIFTSGSTGRPKGVSVPHRCVDNFLSAMQRLTGIQSGSRLLAVTSLSFDISVLELFLPLTVGAEVVIAADEDVIDPEHLASLIADKKIDVMQGTPATWKLLHASNWQPSRPLLALCGGEALSGDLATQLLSKEGVRLINLYGPTETTVWSTACEVTPERCQSSSVSIGRPIENTLLLILDPWGVPTPPGVSGRLFIAGEGVTQGYLGREDLTRHRFVTISGWISDALDVPQDQCWYDTGDLVVWQEDGSLIFLGRADEQVKVRGFRIELGDIEHSLRHLPRVNDAAVKVVGGDRLVAYLVMTRDGLNDSESPSSQMAWIEALRDQLPDYMIPSQYVEIETLPLTPNGKVHRKALPDPRITAVAAAFEPPETETEKKLAELWIEILGASTVGRGDAFFALGGYSLLVLKLRNRIHEVFGVNISLADLFQHESLADMASAIDVDTQRLDASALDDLDAFMHELEQ